MPRRSPAPESDAEAMVSALLTASRLLVAVSARSLAAVEESLTLPQFRMLVVLDGRGPLSLSGLAGELGVQPSTAMRMIDRLVAAGMVARGVSAEDRRTSVISLTKGGRRIVAEATDRRRQEIARIVEAMPPGRRRYLIDALQAFTEAGGEPAVPNGSQAHTNW
ncbi:MarR family winged helix-turn-helix transcriptional regulator [Streptomyces iranensis]|uniref:MarR family transcriptional regulator n=1 Tax=Streptomyces iranensis TaxID=576784 RepID=A0A060ZJ72_9ACTN|nr:MarR family transcriptional regulator [Streptomyces iranensis]MBP2063271.1 DNA-binding MarR family transcriptional regulator [Streptomyces iranensis]CDR01907.1 MarR family transcriptional regulator [Streptomyces iranensis]